jgi:hypothetical protein
MLGNPKDIFVFQSHGARNDKDMDKRVCIHDDDNNIYITVAKAGGSIKPTLSLLIIRALSNDSFEEELKTKVNELRNNISVDFDTIIPTQNELENKIIINGLTMILFNLKEFFLDFLNGNTVYLNKPEEFICDVQNKYPDQTIFNDINKFESYYINFFTFLNNECNKIESCKRDYYFYHTFLPKMLKKSSLIKEHLERFITNEILNEIKHYNNFGLQIYFKKLSLPNFTFETQLYFNNVVAHKSGLYNVDSLKNEELSKKFDVDLTCLNDKDENIKFFNENVIKFMYKHSLYPTYGEIKSRKTYCKENKITLEQYNINSTLMLLNKIKEKITTNNNIIFLIHCSSSTIAPGLLRQNSFKIKAQELCSSYDLELSSDTTDTIHTFPSQKSETTPMRTKSVESIIPCDESCKNLLLQCKYNFDESTTLLPITDDNKYVFFNYNGDYDYVISDIVINSFNRPEILELLRDYINGTVDYYTLINNIIINGFCYKLTTPNFFYNIIKKEWVNISFIQILNRVYNRYNKQKPDGKWSINTLSKLFEASCNMFLLDHILYLRLFKHYDKMSIANFYKLVKEPENLFRGIQEIINSNDIYDYINNIRFVDYINCEIFTKTTGVLNYNITTTTMDKLVKNFKQLKINNGYIVFVYSDIPDIIVTKLKDIESFELKYLKYKKKYLQLKQNKIN